MMVVDCHEIGLGLEHSDVPSTLDFEEVRMTGDRASITIVTSARSMANEMPGIEKDRIHICSAKFRPSLATP